MINFFNTRRQDFTLEGVNIHILKNYEFKNLAGDSFKAENLAILLVRSGSLKIKLKEIIQSLTARDLIIIPKDSDCTIFDAQDQIQLYLISFSSEFAVKNCLKRELIESFYFFIRKEPLKASLEEKEYQVLSLIYKLIHYVNHEAKRTGSDSELQRISLNLFLYELKVIYAKYAIDPVINFSRKESLVIQFLTILSIHYKRQHQVKYYAGSLFVTAGYLSKAVRDVTGKSVKIIIIEALISEAKMLLEDGQMSIAEIAEEMEFDNVSIFGIFFKKHTSLSPTDYRTNSYEKYKNR